MPTGPQPPDEEDIPLADQHDFDRFIQSAKHIRTAYGMTLTFHDAIILDTILRHHTIRAAAHELNITPHTLSNYQQVLFKRFGCHNRQELRLFCQKRGWSSPIAPVAEYTNGRHSHYTKDS